MSGEEHRKEDVFIIIFSGQRVLTCWPDFY